MGQASRQSPQRLQRSVKPFPGRAQGGRSGAFLSSSRPLSSWRRVTMAPLLAQYLNCTQAQYLVASFDGGPAVLEALLSASYQEALAPTVQCFMKLLVSSRSSSVP